MKNFDQIVSIFDPVSAMHRGFASIVLLSKVWRHNYASRHDLAMLDERALRDIGLSRQDALKESYRPFWEV